MQSALRRKLDSWGRPSWLRVRRRVPLVSPEIQALRALVLKAASWGFGGARPHACAPPPAEPGLPVSSPPAGSAAQGHGRPGLPALTTGSPYSRTHAHPYALTPAHAHRLPCTHTQARARAGTLTHTQRTLAGNGQCPLLKGAGAAGAAPDSPMWGPRAACPGGLAMGGDAALSGAPGPSNQRTRRFLGPTGVEGALPGLPPVGSRRV